MHNSLELVAFKVIAECIEQKGFRPILFDSDLFPRLFFVDKSNAIVHIIEIDIVINEVNLPKTEKREFWVHYGILYWHNFDRNVYLKHDVKIHQISECDKYFSSGWATLGSFLEGDYSSMIESFQSQFDDIINLSMAQVENCKEHNDSVTDIVNHIGVCFDKPEIAIYYYLLQNQWEGSLCGI